MFGVMSIAELNTLYAAGAAAYDEGDYATALTVLRKTWLRLATIADVERKLAGSGSQSLTFTRRDLSDLLKDCRQALAASVAATSGMFRTSKIIHQRPTA
ncbi:hypothetical protein LCGC14_1671730 [marine sediment metagenome]|uniref:Uncharacterized protein n=1 Tax=marine sediment metagenome TaxID=412755 RepID=A0A0F9K6X4_9ZZZZ